LNISGDKKKKVLLTVNNNKLSGIERFTLLLGKYLDKSRYEVEIGIPVYGPLCKNLEENGIDYFIFENKVTGKTTLRGMLSLFKNIYRKNYDIIHAQAGIVPCMIGKFLGAKLIIEHKHGLDFTSEQIEKFSFKRLNYERLKKYFVNRTITVCEADRRTLIKRFKYKAGKVNVVYNGIENLSSDFKTREKGRFTLGTVGRLTYQKGQEYFIEMAKILTNHGFDFEFLIYGDGEKSNEYKELIEKYNLSDRVFLKGYTNNVSDVLSSFDIFVLPSRYEGIPYVILEAMKENVPVVSANVGGINEVIIDNINGLLVRNGDAEGLAEKALQIYYSEELRNNLVQAARKDFEEKFTIQETVNSIEGIYEICRNQ
jgi:glycosyltransferase involved in cell wall biosynthesis